MSEASKMGLIGSKDDKCVNKEDSPEDYAYDTEALSIMDINDIIGVQSEPVGDSTLEGEMAALSAMITDTKSHISEQDTVEADGDVPVERDGTSSMIVDENIHENEGKVVKQLKKCPDLIKRDEKASEDLGKESTINKSLQLIGEAYDSDDSQNIESDDETSIKEPKVLFSCKPLVDKHNRDPGDDITDLTHAQEPETSVKSSAALKSDEKTVSSTLIQENENNSDETIIELSKEIPGSSVNSSEIPLLIKDHDLEEGEEKSEINKSEISEINTEKSELSENIKENNEIEELKISVDIPKIESTTEEMIIDEVLENKDIKTDFPMKIPDDLIPKNQKILNKIEKEVDQLSESIIEESIVIEKIAEDNVIEMEVDSDTLKDSKESGIQIETESIIVTEQIDKIEGETQEIERKVLSLDEKIASDDDLSSKEDKLLNEESASTLLIKELITEDIKSSIEEIKQDSPVVDEKDENKCISDASEVNIEASGAKTSLQEVKSIENELKLISSIGEPKKTPEIIENLEKSENLDEEIVEKSRKTGEIIENSPETVENVSEVTKKSELIPEKIEITEDLKEKNVEESEDISLVVSIEKITSPDEKEPKVEEEVSKMLNTEFTSEDSNREALEKNSTLELEVSPSENPNQPEDLFDEIIEGLSEIPEEDLTPENVINASIKKSVSKKVEKSVEGDENLEMSLKHIERSFNLDQQEKINIPDELLADYSPDVEVTMDPLASNPEISELECAVKFLQESEDQEMESPLVLSPKSSDDVPEVLEEPQPHIFTSTDDICDDQNELEAELDDITDPIAISEAEIISEAAKLESERKLKEEAQIPKQEKIPEKIESNPIVKSILSSSNLPKISILEERLREPPKIEIPVSEPRISESPTTPKTRESLLIQRDAKINYHKLDSPKSREDSRILDSPRKDHEIENIGSPRIILKIAKSAIADCAEPRSPKSPKIRSAADSPNPEDSPGQKLGKIRMKLSRSGHPSIISNDNIEEQRIDLSGASLSPLGMKIKLSKTGDASIVPQDLKDLQRNKIDGQSPKRTDSPLGMKFKLSKSGDASIIPQVDKIDEERGEISQEVARRTDSPFGVKIKLSKSGDATIIPSDHEDQEIKRTDSPSFMKMKISKKSGASILESISENKEKLEIPEFPKRTESPLGMKIKLSKSGDASIIHTDDIIPDKNPEISQLSPGTSEGVSPGISSPIGMKIKLSKTGDATIIHPEDDLIQDSRRTDSPFGMKIKLSKSGDASIIQSEHEVKTLKSDTSIESMKIKLSKTGHPTIITSDSLEMNIYQSSQINRSSEVTIEPVKSSEDSLKRRDPTTSSVDSKKFKLETKLSHILPEVTIQPLSQTDSKQSNSSSPSSSSSSSPSGPPASISRQQMNVINREISITHVRSVTDDFSKIEKEPDVEIIEPHPELIMINENSNSSQDVMIIDEVLPLRMPEVKVPKKRGRPRTKNLPLVEALQDPLALDEPSSAEPRENERPKRTCSRQKSYAPPKRGRGRGRGKRKIDRNDYLMVKKARIEQNLAMIEARTTSLITLDDELARNGKGSSELYKALRQPIVRLDGDIEGLLERGAAQLEGLGKMEEGKDGKEIFGTPDRQNWLTPSSKKIMGGGSDICGVQVIDEETRMSAESFSRSQTPARNIGAHAGETIINEESQGSVLSTATTESEKVKVKNRRMEINFDPDEGPFTVEKIAEYEWPTDRKGDTFMIQEQISQYLGVKSFKRKYPDLKRRMVDMEERNHLRENGLVSESMCDMGLTAVCSSEVLDIMCSDFPDQYEEYRKHMREKQIKEHSKKQKELTAAANAEKNRIDLAEMAVQSALSWNVGFNKARKESRKCSLDLQTFTIHVPKKQLKIEDNRNVSHYPVALIPGQYTDYYREYTPAELRYYPLNTVLYGPMKPNERKFDSQSEGSQSDSDSDSSSDDSSDSSSDGTQDTEGSQSTMDDVDMELSTQKDKSFKCKMCLKHFNKFGKVEVLIQCGTCNGYVHPSCIDLTLDMVPHIQGYSWQCTDCKTCAQCHDPADEDKMLFCDMCDRGYHIYCVGLRRVPQGRWHCTECAICASCGSREAGGVNADRNSVAQWQHEYKKGDKNTRVYVSTLCVPCSKLWRKGRYCPHCSRCHTVPRLDLEDNLVHCSACDKYLHLDCLESKDLIINRKNYQCDFCIITRQQMGKSLVSKAFKS